MKALSLRQPWAAAVLTLGKRIENRKWWTNFRGEFLIHAAKGMTLAEWAAAVDVCEDVLGVARCYDIQAALEVKTLARGGIVGIARLVDVVKPRPEFMIGGVASHYPVSLREDGWRWHFRDRYGFVLADVRPTPFVPCAGSLGFFNVPDDVERAALGRAA